MGGDGEVGLSESELAGGWLAQFRDWHEQARSSGMAEPDAMVLGTASAEGMPSGRSVLLKGVDERGFEFFTNYDSRKGVELAENPRASLVFPWYPLQRQVIAIGSVETVAQERSEEYFASRPYRSRLGALSSSQSSVIPDRATLEQAKARLEAEYPPDGPVPRPHRWGGFRVVPETVEFWQGRRDRLHDRLRFRRTQAGGWIVERLSP
jgi:pyridoxamine 5'-phosphate oxidase